MKLVKIIGIPLGIASLLILGGAFNKPVKGEFDVPGLNTQVQNQQKELDNHEVRITNVEADVGSLQQNTDTPPAPHQTVPDATPAPTPEPSPTPDPEPAPHSDGIYNPHPVNGCAGESGQTTC